MFLAIKEIRHSMTRFVAICAVVFLVSYLVYFLTGLAWGLASSYTQAIETWNAKSISLTKESNKNSLASFFSLKETTYDEDNSAPLSVSSVAVENRDEETKADQSRVNVFLFGIDFDSFLAPPLSEGKEAIMNNQAVVDDSLKRYGYKLGDEIEIPDLDDSLKIVGFTSGTKFQATPVVYLTQGAFAKSQGDRRPEEIVSALVNLKPADKAWVYNGSSEIQTVPISDFIGELPGYKAQYLTFILMIGSLIVILSLVLAIFMYVLTIQKKHIFGIMKAQGVPTAYIARAGAAQTLIITIAGVGIGLVAAVISGLALAPKLPFEIEPRLFALVSVAFVVFTLLGSLFPIRVIARIDPIRAIG